MHAPSVPAAWCLRNHLRVWTAVGSRQHALAPGFLETVYGRAPAFEMGEMGLAMECGKKIQVRYKGVIVGDFFADMIIGDSVLMNGISFTFARIL